MDVEEMRGTLKKMTITHGTDQDNRAHGHQRDMGQEWSEVVAALGPSTPLRPPKFEWEPSKTVFLVPENAEEAQ